MAPGFINPRCLYPNLGGALEIIQRKLALGTLEQSLPQEYLQKACPKENRRNQACGTVAINGGRGLRQRVLCQLCISNGAILGGVAALSGGVTTGDSELKLSTTNCCGVVTFGALYLVFIDTPKWFSKQKYFLVLHRCG